MSVEKRNRLPWELAPVILTLALPTMLEQFLETAVQYIDTAMVGALGTQATAAVGATTTINWLINGTVSAIGVGFLSYISKACGAGDRERARRAASQAVLITLVVGVLFTALTLGLSRKVPVWMQVDVAVQELASRYFFVLYTPMLARAAMILFGTLLRSVGDSRTPMRVGLAVNCINVVLNFILIYPTRTWHGMTLYGAGMGVVGAAAASAAAFLVGGIAMTAALWRHPVLSPRNLPLKPDGAILLPCLRVALPNALQRFGTSLGYVAFAAMINSLGEIATAAHTIANTVESAFYVPGYGMQTASATLAGNALGAGDHKKLRNLARMLLFLEMTMMLLSGGLLFLFARNMMGLFSRDAAVIALGTVVLRMVAVSEPFYGASIVLEGMMQGMGRTVLPFTFGILGMWGVRIAGTFLCTQRLGLGLVSAWGCMIAHNLLIFALFLICYLTGNWKPREEKGELNSEKVEFPVKSP